MPTMVLEDMMSSSKTRSVKQLSMLSLINMLPQQWLEHKITETISQVAMKVLILVTL